MLLLCFSSDEILGLVVKRFLRERRKCPASWFAVFGKTRPSLHIVLYSFQDKER
jgi:hypothetical protein